MHDHHESLPGYDERQILHDGCAECEGRSRERNHGIAHLDNWRFEEAWRRAAQFGKSSAGLGIAAAEVPLLDVLWSVQVQFERRGTPIGMLPA